MLLISCPGIGGTVVPSPWHLLGSLAEWYFTCPKLGGSWGAAAFIVPITRKMRDGDAGIDRGVYL